MSNNYLARPQVDAKRAIDYAPFKRQLRHSLRPAGVLGPAAIILLLAAAGAVLALAYSLAG